MIAGRDCGYTFQGFEKQLSAFDTETRKAAICVIIHDFVGKSIHNAQNIENFACYFEKGVLRWRGVKRYMRIIWLRVSTNHLKWLSTEAISVGIFYA